MIDTADRERTPETTRPRVAVVDVGDELGLVALEVIQAGEVVVPIRGVVVDRPSRISMQMAADRHVITPTDLDLADLVRDHPWRFLNHSCRPNGMIRGTALVAVRRIASGEQVTFDYEANEYELASPFTCRCGSIGCRGQEVRGFAHLSSEERVARLPWLTEYLRQMLAAPSPSQPAEG